MVSSPFDVLFLYDTFPDVVLLDIYFFTYKPS